MCLRISIYRTRKCFGRVFNGSKRCSGLPTHACLFPNDLAPIDFLLLGRAKHNVSQWQRCCTNASDFRRGGGMLLMRHRTLLESATG